jgi:hydroxyproline transport system permease protein
MKFQLPYSGLQWSDLPFLLTGIFHTILLTVVAAAIGTVIGIIIGWLRESSVVARYILASYVDVTRSVPLIIQFILVNSVFSLAGLALDPFVVGVIVLSLYMGVLTSELVRSGLQSVRPELKKASRSLGMNYWQELFHVSGPLALRTSFPSWVGTVIALAKDTSLVGVVGYVDILRATQILINRTNEALLMLGVTGLFYFLICYPISLYSRRLERTLQ